MEKNKKRKRKRKKKEVFVDKNCGVGRDSTEKVLFIHASVLQGAVVLTIGTDAWGQVVSGQARAEATTEREEPGDGTRVDEKGARRRRTEWRSKQDEQRR